MKNHSRFHLNTLAVRAVIFGWLGTAFISPATITPIAWYRLGENDGAAVSAPATGGTREVLLGAHLAALGAAPVYSAGAALPGSTLSLAFNGGGFTKVEPVLALTDNWGLEAWVQSDNPALQAMLAYNGNSGPNGMGLYQIGGNYVGLVGGLAFVGGTPVTSNWTHLAIVVSGGTSTFYVNGVVNGIGPAPNRPTTAFNIGISQTGADPFSGRIDEVRVFTFAPGQFSTNDLMLGTVPAYPTAPLALKQVGGAVRVGNLATNAGATAFARDLILGGGAPAHTIPHLNDGIYGNANSWIGDSDNSFAGIAFGRTVLVSRVAFGRDNTGTYGDRTDGHYLLQYTTVASPDATTPDSSWITIGALFYDPALPQCALRHEWEFAGVAATGLRLIVPGHNFDTWACLDELEAYGPALVLNEIGGAPFPSNLATQPGATAFAKDVIAGGAIPVHQIAHLNDATFGNHNSWIGDSLNSFVGISFGAVTQRIGRVAWGRDNTATYVDRAAGLYRLEFTTVPNPDASTPDSAWTLIGTVTYDYNGPGGTPISMALRHAWSFPPVNATGIRLTTPGNSFADGACIDELEVAAYAPPPLRLRAVGGAMMRAANLALSGTAFAKDVIGGGAFPAHTMAHLNDGVYGNDNSWIGDSPGSFAGIALGGSHRISRVAFGRSNTGVHTDRAQGNYLLQYTTVPNPGAATPDGDWTTLGPVYLFPDDARRALRHEYEFGPVTATGIRLVVPGVDMGSYACIDELEVYAAPPSLVQTGGAMNSHNVALGATPFGRDELHYDPPWDPGHYIHLIEDINDGLYGNDHSWLGNSDESFVGVAFSNSVSIYRLAFGRDNTDRYTDRTTGKYVLQYTTVPNPDASTPDGAWITLGQVHYDGESRAESLRHLYEFPVVEATGVRVIAPGDGAAGGAVLDELEVYRVNTPPVANDDHVATSEDRAVGIPVVKLLTNDTDADGDPLTVVSTSATSTNGGSVVPNAGEIAYTPLPGFVGEDRFSYTVSDGFGGLASAQVQVLVYPGGQASLNMLPLTPVADGWIVRFAGIPGRSYTVQRSPHVTGPWQNWTNVVASALGITAVEDVNPPQPQAFYRTVAP